MSVSSFVQVLRERAEATPEARAYTFLTGGEETAGLSFARLERRARAVASRLQRLNAKGERALLLYPPGLEYVAAFYGCLMAGAVAVPAYPPRMNRNMERLESILEDAAPRAVLTTEAVYRQLQRRFDESPHLRRLGWVVTDEVADEEAEGWADPNVGPDTLAFLQYTSASTSKPKGVMVSHGNILHNQLLMGEAVQHGPDVVAVSWLPLFHDMGLISVVLASLYNGFPCHLMSPVDFLKRPRVWLEAITRYKATFSGSPDFGFQLCVDRIGPEEREGLDLSHWRVAYNGSEPIRAGTLENFSKAFGPVGFRREAMFSCYGLAEYTLFASGRFFRGAQTFSRASLEEHRPRAAEAGQLAHLVSCGAPLLDSRAVIADPRTRRRCPEGEIGEIWLASPSVAGGYWNKPEQSESVFRARLADGDGPFMRTGDLGFRHGEELFVTGRLKDLIIIRGRNIIPQDVEQTVERCDPAVRPAFVAAVSVDAEGAERLVVAAEVRREVRNSTDNEALMERIRASVAREYTVDVSAVVLLKPNTLPKTSSGKTQRAKLRQDFLDGALEVQAEWRDEAVFGGRAKAAASAGQGWGPERVENWLAGRIAAHAKLAPERVDRDRALHFYGVDSVIAAALVCEIEDTFGLSVDLDHLFEDEPTVRQFARRILRETKAAGRPKVTPGEAAARARAETAVAPPPQKANGNGASNGHGASNGKAAPNGNGAKVVSAPGGGNGHSAQGRTLTLKVPKPPSNGAAKSNGSAPNGSASNGKNGKNGHAAAVPAVAEGPAAITPAVVFKAPAVIEVPVVAETPAATEPAPQATWVGVARHDPDHPFRTSVNPELGRALAQMAMDKTFVRGEGSWLWDAEGRRYLDFLAQYGALPLGFNPKRIWDALYAVRESGEPSFVQPSFLDAAGELARRLLAAAPPGMKYVTFGNSGAEAVEAAIKLCRSTTGRHNVLAGSNSFHGKTLGALSATDKKKYQAPFGAPVPGFDFVPYGDADALRRALSTRRYAAFIVEPVQGEGGIVEPPTGYLRFARKACRETGTLFVADEIQTGLGRTGAMFVCGALGITPDVLTVAKALGGGLVPIGACLSTAAAYNEEFALRHTSTFAGNTLACRAGIALLDALEENDHALVNRVAENGARLKEGLLDLQRRFPRLVGDVRGRGYLLGLRFHINRNTVPGGLLGYFGEQEMFTLLVASHLLHFEGVRVGCTLNQGGVLRIEPPLTATWDECLFLLRALERVLLRLERGDLSLLTAHVTGLELPAAAFEEPAVEVTPAEVTEPRPRVEQRSDDGRFAFLVHPLAWKDYSNLDRTLSPLSEEQLATLSTAIADNFDPVVIGETRVVAANGKAAYGEFILVPRRAEELKALPREVAVEEIRRAVTLGRERGAKVIGLGAYTSVVTNGGLSLKGAGVPALTTGNSYTAVASRQTVRMAAAERGWQLPRRTVAVVGAAGAIGQALSILLACDVGRLILLGNPEHAEESRQRLLKVAGRIVWSVDKLRRAGAFSHGSVASWITELNLGVPARLDSNTLTKLGEELIARTGSVVVSVDHAALLPLADVVVCCTSTTERLVRGELLRPGAVVCDTSRPSNVDPAVRESRPDVMVLDGGVISLPGDSVLGFNASLPEGHAYACMAETMMLAIDQRYRDMSLGFELPLEQVLEMELLADELGFRPVLERKGGAERVEGFAPVGLRPAAGAEGARA
ncbi:MAG TPA: aminotransferase class III-fold pyridoxal phosphate-dependent enzyme [Pyrinomonadaceae bacterium]|jgi:acetylornithine/succinyldiaminopimelate/putrescine aminotransferase/acyl-CoA synthetase (AMP-forming)/AMP-acid ligase II/predicted amino acid dehydrogenase/acyl carrier protein